MKKTCRNCRHGRKTMRSPYKRKCAVLNVETNADRNRHSCAYYNKELWMGNGWPRFEPHVIYDKMTEKLFRR